MSSNHSSDWAQTTPAPPALVMRSMKFRIYPNKSQILAIEGQLAECCRLYNAAIQERRDAWKMCRKRITFYDQHRQLKDIRADGDIGVSSFKVAAAVLYRVDRAFQSFFRRVRRGETPGFPRFKAGSRFDSLGTEKYGEAIGLSRDRLRLRLFGVGEIKVRWHRPLEGTPKTALIKREGCKWFVIFACQVEAVAVPPLPSSVGIDVGLIDFATLSDGCAVPAPRLFRHSASRLRAAQRALARSRRNSQRRRLAASRVRAITSKVGRQRADFAHKLSRDIVQNYGRIAVEDLNIKGLARTRLAKSIHDAGWRLFLEKLRYKAESAGRVFVEVDPAGTSQTCICGERVPKTLKDRWHECPSCGLSEPRDLVSAMVIEARGRRVQALTEPIGPVVCGAAI